MSDTATRPDALDLYEQLATSANTVVCEAGAIRACDVLGLPIGADILDAARRALTDGLRALDQFEGREG